jgi:hypothetical protein
MLLILSPSVVRLHPRNAQTYLEIALDMTRDLNYRRVSEHSKISDAMDRAIDRARDRAAELV